MGQLYFSTLSESQKVDICQQFNVNPNDGDAECKINSIIAQARSQKTDDAHKMFLRYEDARNQRLVAEQTYTDLSFNAKLQGKPTDTSTISLARNKYMTCVQTESSLDTQHDILAERALDSCTGFFVIG